MTKFGYSLYCEGNDPRDLIKQAVMAEAAGFDFLIISDHYHPWLTNQEHSGFAWSILGAVAQATSKVQLATMVTCPIVRYHPAIVAQMAATMGVISDGRFTLGLGSGERLNEHVVGKGWPAVTERHEMLEEATDIIKQLWQGDYVNYQGKHFKVEDARVFDLPDKPLQFFTAAGGSRAAKLAAKTGGGLCITDASKAIVQAYTDAGGDSSNVWGQVVTPWAPTTEQAAQELHAQFRFSVGGWKVQAELPNPVNFDAATQTVKPEDMAKQSPAGPDAQAHAKNIKEYVDAGIQYLALAYPGDDPQAFMKFWTDELKPLCA